MSFLSKLFGGGGTGGETGPAKPAAEEEYKGFIIKATPMAAGSEHQLAGTIEKQIDGELKNYKFVRADRLATRDEAALRAIDKGRQLVDEQGDRLFS
ncbi:MAG TPA: HlyU family transcriptional regulator [Devosiaceae bacterium]|nr:HlyU family transcriptional regulator [Devosiaceae bacterium]